ncbi:MAG TPA: hypothetical protein VKE96_08450 [Vicinamibacterales bacterium]|nr:hypothetical protein [Vicinamibacterales bacterium]
MTWRQALKQTALVAVASASFAGINAVRTGEIAVTAAERGGSSPVRVGTGDETFDVGRLYRAARRELVEHFEQIVDILARHC